MATYGGFYVDQENMVPGQQGGQAGRRMAGKNVALKAVGLGEQRSALGEITNVTTRRAPTGKASKQVTNIFSCWRIAILHEAWLGNYYWFKRRKGCLLFAPSKCWDIFISFLSLNWIISASCLLSSLFTKLLIGRVSVFLQCLSHVTACLPSTGWKQELFICWFPTTGPGWSAAGWNRGSAGQQRVHLVVTCHVMHTGDALNCTFSCKQNWARTL